MSGGKHTPGDWYVCPGKPPADCDDPLCTGIYTDFYDLHGKAHAQGVLHPDGRRITAEQARANAVLMAAAPDLLEAAELLARAGAVTYEGATCPLCSYPTTEHSMGCPVSYATRAIAKAKGEAA